VKVPGSRPRTKNPHERRNDLLDAAESVLVDGGMGALTIDEIVARAGVAKGTFYLYFRSKEHVLSALQDRFVETLVAAQRTRLAELRDGDWTDQLELWMESSIRGYLDNTELHDALFLHGPSGGHSRAGALHPANQHLHSLEEILRCGIEAGEFTVTSPTAAAVLLYAAMHGAADYAIDHPAHVAADDLIAEARRLCRRLVTEG
jgi:AcrR family transcriptional regulator